MTKSQDSTPNTENASAVTKHIKIYSDNPIHDAIDRIINSCACIDENDDYCYLASLELREAAEELFVLACTRLNKIYAKYQPEIHAESIDKE